MGQTCSLAYDYKMQGGQNVYVCPKCGRRETTYGLRYDEVNPSARAESGPRLEVECRERVT
jgi:hypothetical protein